MKTTRIFTVLLLCLTLLSCNSDDDSCNCNDDENNTEYPKIVNIKYEVLANTGNLLQVINTTLNNDNQEHIAVMPFIFSYTQQEVNVGTYVKLAFLTQTFDEDSLELRILVDNEVVASQVFNITTQNQAGFIEYTFQ